MVIIMATTTVIQIRTAKVTTMFIRITQVITVLTITAMVKKILRQIIITIRIITDRCNFYERKIV